MNAHGEDMEERSTRRIPIRFAQSEETPSDYPARPHTSEKMAAEPEITELDATIQEIGQDLLAASPSEEATAARPAESPSEIARLHEEKQALYERMIRLAAEFENYRKRIERDRERMREEIVAEVLTQLLPIVDDFERALEGAKWLREIDGLLQGLDLIYRRLLEVLARFNVRPIESLGRPFDPMRHEALAVEPTDEYPENTILDEYQRGYMMGDRLLRPARVKVAVRPTSGTSSKS